MKTKPKTFDAVAASRRWRAETSRTLDAMPVAERIAFLEGLRTDQRPHPGPVPADGACTVREEPETYDAPGKEAAP
jgi:hypothetical protein